MKEVINIESNYFSRKFDDELLIIEAWGKMLLEYVHL